jgi:Flp pilus assembly protein TadD
MKHPPARRGFSVSLAAALLLALAAAGAWLWLKSPRMPRQPRLVDNPVFHRDIASIVFAHCSPCHHPSEAAPFSLLSYDDVKKRAGQIADVTRRRLMPPWLPEHGLNDFVGDRSLNDGQIELIHRWVRQGAVEGNPADAPPPPQWRDGWQLGTPDLIVRPPAAYTLAAEGKDVYRTFVLPIPVVSNRFVRAVELLPGNTRVVHHAFMYIDPTRESRRRDGRDAEPGFPGLHTPPTAQAPPGQFLSWQPGKIAADDGEFSWLLQKDSDLVLQMHLRPSGKPESLQPEVGFYFSDRTPAQTPFKFGLWTHEIDIPVGATNHVVEQSWTLPSDVEVLRVLPHAHYLGRKLEGFATLPDGSQRWLIRIPEWDFNWQGDYTYRQPIALPRGTTIAMRYGYDNSTNNARNPHQPPRRVRYGINSDDEMAELWFQVVPRQSNDLAVLEKAYQPRVFRSVISFNTYLLSQDPDNARACTEMGKASLFLDQPVEALRHLTRALALQPSDEEGHYYLGLLHRTQRRLAEAKAEFRATLELKPDHAKAHGNLGLMLMEEGDWAAAETHFRSALRINPGDTIARESLEDIVKIRAGDNQK